MRVGTMIFDPQAALILLIFTLQLSGETDCTKLHFMEEFPSA